MNPRPPGYEPDELPGCSTLLVVYYNGYESSTIGMDYPRAGYYDPGMQIPFLLAVLLASCSACVEEPGAEPLVHVRVVSSEGPVDEYVLRGARAWGEIGFDVGEDDAAIRECRIGWEVADGVDCQITIGIVREPGVPPHSHRDWRTIWLPSELGGIDLQIAAAHEFGHVLLDTPTHTPAGVMSGRRRIRLDDDDRALACDAIGVCQ